MANPVITRLQAQRDEQIAFVDNLLSKVESDQRDPVDAETANLTAARERIQAIDAQLAPLVEFEQVRESSQATAARLLGGGTSETGARRAMASVSEPEAYASPAEMLAETYRAVGDRTRQVEPDARAAERLSRAVAKQTTDDTPGILPKPLVGQVVNLIDATRPLVTSLGVRPMGNVPGKVFSRPKITQHSQVGKQSAEKTELPSRQMTIGSLDFTKATYGGSVNISRQDIDWTSPAAWDILIRDLADQYSIFTETSVATDFATAVTQTIAVPEDTLHGWALALYQAAAQGYAGGARMPDRVWCSVDMWATMGAITDTARLSFAARADGNAGTSNLAQFSGDILAVPRIVVPHLPEKTVIVGNSTLFEFYEATIGLLTAIEPSILGVEVAYGGYAAWGAIEAKGFCKVTPPVPAETKAGK